MHPNNRPPYKLPEPPGLPGLERRAGELRLQLQTLSPDVIASRAQVAFLPSSPDASNAGEFRFSLFHAPVTGTYPELIFSSGPAQAGEFNPGLLG